MAGLDGCRGGWVQATVEVRPAAVPALVGLDRIDDAIALAADCEDGRLAVVGIDIPLALPAIGPRDCDREARRLLGPRRASIFPAPIAAVAGATTYEDALATSRQVSGKGLSVQAYNLLPAIRQISRLQSRLGEERAAHQLFEVSPELSFAALAGTPLGESKKTAGGLARRRALLVGVLDDPAGLLARPVPRAAPDDVLDAVAVAWSATRILTKDARRLGVGPETIWW